MLWYLLYPYRGTKEPPLPSSESVVRRAFYRHGALVSRYWLPLMLSVVTFGVILSYPALFMSDFPPGRIDSLPHHVWTGSAPFESRTEKQPDLEMRQVWLRGDYMQALNRSILQEAFRLERELLLDHSSPVPALAPQTDDWAVHSPTLFWHNNPELLNDDADLLHTINDFKNEAAFSQLDLWPMSVFAGKTFRQKKLIGADALVLTLLSRQNTSIASIWDANLKTISSSEASSPWTVQNPGNTTHDNVYEYRFQPFSINQYWSLVGAYLCMLFYTAASLRRLKAFKSRFGVTLTAITQMGTSILASFTICGLLRINLNQIPQEAYPFVVLVIGLENIFRLINAILAYPPEMDTTERVANGLGDTGIASLASAAQNLAILWVLSQIVSPGVSAFCTFAAIALLFDFFLLITLFVAVLSVDIRRMELQDSLSRPRGASRRRKRPFERQSWIDGLIQGRVPFSTRMAGSAITITFVLLLNWHLSDTNVSFFGGSPWSSPTTKRYQPSLGTEPRPTPSSELSTNAASWSNAYNSSTAAAQFMHVIKPGATSFTARVFDPVVILVGDADRSNIPLPRDTWLHAVRDLATHHFYPFALVVVFVVAFVTVLMSILLWEWEERTAADAEPTDEGPLSCKTIDTVHRLDIEDISSTQDGTVLSVGLDRSLSLATKSRMSTIWTKTNVRLSLPGPLSGSGSHIRWAIDACATDSRTGQMAALCRNGLLLLGRTQEATISKVIQIPDDLATEGPILFDFVARNANGTPQSALLMLFGDGSLLELNTQHNTLERITVGSDENGIATAVVHAAESSSKLVVLTNLGSILGYAWEPMYHSWRPLAYKSKSTRPSVAAPAAREAWLQSIPALDILLLCTPDEMQILNGRTLLSATTLPLSHAKRDSVHILHSEPYQTPRYDLPACDIFTLAYTASRTNTLHLQSYEHAPDPICPASTNLVHLTPTASTLPNPGSYLPTSRLALAGIRRAPKPSSSPSSSSSSTTTATTTPMLRRRRASPARDDSPAWQAYSLSHTGELVTAPVREEGGHLFAHALGKAVRLGRDAVGIAMGNVIVAVEVRAGIEEGRRRSGSRSRRGNSAIRLGRGRE